MNKRLRGGTAIASRAASHVALALLGAYRLVLSPLLPRACRFHPSCSSYARDAIREHGPWQGSLLAIRRVLRCHPFHPGGYDPVPAKSGGGGYHHITTPDATGQGDSPVRDAMPGRPEHLIPAHDVAISGRI